MNNLSTNLFKVFFPNEAKEVIKEKNLSIVHYTSAETAHKIISSKTFWLRDSRMMNDTSEISHAKSCLRVFIDSPRGAQAISQLNSIHADCAQNILNNLHRALEFNTQEIFVASLSLQSQVAYPEGKLSMWRAYSGNSAGVALHFAPENFFRDQSDAIAVVVNYHTTNSFADDLFSKLDFINNNGSKFSQLTQTEFIHFIVMGLLFTVLSTKDESFDEEQELRLLVWKDIESDLIKSDALSINGIPQKIKVLDLKKHMEQAHADFIRLFREIVIGPSNHQHVIKNAFDWQLSKNGPPTYHSRVRCAKIPLRTSQ